MSDNPIISQISEAITPLIEENSHLRESIDEIRAMLDYEDQGWRLIAGAYGADDGRGLSLEDVKNASIKARTRVAASSLPKRAADLHAGYVFGNGVEISDTKRDPGAKGRIPGEVRFYEDPINQEALFSGAAKRELQYSRFSDGNVIVFCDTSTRQVRRVPIFEIGGYMSNPDQVDEVWAWLRVWDRVKENGETETRREWVYTNRFSGQRRSGIRYGDELVPVAKNKTAVDLRCNRQTGWVLGVPDALSGLHWSEAYGEVLQYGRVVNKGLSQIIYKITQKTQKGAQNVGVKLSGGSVGSAAVLGEGQDIQLVNSAQRSFDFTAPRPLAAMAAAAWNVTTPDLLADSSAAGSSYGSLNALTPGMQNAMQAMRDEWTQFYTDVFQVMGFKRPTLTWPPMNEPDEYRKAQELTLYSVALTDQEYRAAVLDRLQIPGDSSVIPPLLAMRGEVPKQAASPDQGVPNSTGGADSTDKNDLAQEMRDQNFLDELRGLVERLEAAKG